MSPALHAALVDPLIPGLTAALDGPTVVGFLRDAGIDAEHVVAEAIRYRTGERCTIRYEITTGIDVRVVFGKVFGRNAVEIAGAAASLAHESRRDGRLPIMLPVVALVEQCGLVLFEGCPNPEEFHRIAVDATVDPAVRSRRWRQLGTAIASLHRSAVVGLHPRRATDDLAELGSLAGVVGSIDTSLGVRFTKLLDRLSPLLSGTPRQLVPSHGALRTDQVLISNDRIALVDLDDACLADPGRDVGNLVAYLEWKVIRGAAAATIVASAINDFTTAYTAVKSLDDARLDDWRAASMLKIAGRRYKARQYDELPLVPALLNAVETLIC